VLSRVAIEIIKVLWMKTVAIQNTDSTSLLGFPIKSLVATCPLEIQVSLCVVTDAIFHLIVTFK
jgi:hypothetical protein